MSVTMRRIVLASRPEGEPNADNFRIEEGPAPELGPDEVLARVEYMSLDPYMRGRMNDAKSYAAPVELGATMEGGGVGEVLASNSPAFAPGDKVLGGFGWATHAVQPASALRKLDPAHGPISAALGVLGMPGFTGWHGLNAIGQPKSGETLVVAAATGPVGSMVGQLAKAKGLRVVGVAGGAEKCALAEDTFGFDACLDHRAFDDGRALRRALAEQCPDGIDIYFENVGGKVLDAVIPLMNNHGRIPVCGMIAWYNGAVAPGLSLPQVWQTILVKFLHVQGFIISNHWDKLPAFLSEVGPMVAAGDIKYIEDIAEGLEAAPSAFLSLLKGGNLGKQLVKLS